MYVCMYIHEYVCLYMSSQFATTRAVTIDINCGPHEACDNITIELTPHHYRASRGSQ